MTGLPLRLLHRAAAVGSDFGVLPYRPTPASSTEWESSYQSGAHDPYERLEELARYSILAGYLGLGGGERTILDVGCGRGLLRTRIGEQFTSYLGVDVAPSAIADAGDLADERTAFRCLDVMDLPVRPFDAVVLNEVLYLVERPAELIRRVRQILSPGGMLLTSMWSHPGDRSLWRMIDRSFRPVDRVAVRNTALPKRRNTWRVSYHESR